MLRLVRSSVRRVAMRYFTPALAALLLSACAPLRQDPNLPRLEPMPSAEDVRLEQVVSEATTDRQSGFRLLAEGREALDWRVGAARTAEQRLHIQYYIWRDDTVGRLLIAELLAAADRGVDVRLLLDDMVARGNDRALLLLDQHDNVEIRIFNPFRTRSGVVRAGVELLFRSAALNHRMHNKLWIADGHLAILGGRNIGDEYFKAGHSYNFSDLDIAMVGRLAEQADAAFVAYWNSPAAVPIRQVSGLRKEADEVARRYEGMRAWLMQYRNNPSLGIAVEVEAERIGALTAPDSYVWTNEAELVVDDPNKALRYTELAPGTYEAIVERFRAVEDELLLISPYFVPGRLGTDRLVQLAEQGVEVGVLTNSLAATDVVFAHSGYARRRRALLEGGVQLHELRPTVWARAYPEEVELGIGSSRASLHTKALVLDGREVFIGSFNLDPRSANINTELGVFVIHDDLARELRRLYLRSTAPEFAYRLELTEDGRLIWHADSDQQYTSDPKASLWRRLAAALARLLPIESQL